SPKLPTSFFLDGPIQCAWCGSIRMFFKAGFKAPKFKNPQGLGKEHLSAITQHLGHLGDLDADAAARAIRFVVDGQDEDVLLALGGMKEAAVKIGLVSIYSSGINHKQVESLHKERARIFGTGKHAAPAVWHRLGHVLD